MNPEGHPISAANNLAMPDQVWRARILEDSVIIANEAFSTSASVTHDGFTPLLPVRTFPPSIDHSAIQLEIHCFRIVA
jgi:hypothetical protein